MRKKQLTIFVGLLSMLVLISLFLVQRILVQERTRPMVSPADFVHSKRQALDLLGGLVNQGFHVRDGSWDVSLSRKKMALLQLTLFSGNQYWFAAASSSRQRLKLVLYDAAGDRVTRDLWKEDHTVPGTCTAGGLLVSKSGNYYIGLALVDAEGEQPVPASLVYAYR